MRFKIFLSAIAGLSFSYAPISHAQEAGLDFLNQIPEFQSFFLKMTEAHLQSAITKNELHFKKDTKNDHTTYWVLTVNSENVFVRFDSKKCTAIQRMQRIPKKLIKNEIGESEYEAWIARRSAKHGSEASP